MPEAFPVGLPTWRPQILSGACTVTGSTTCLFPNAFSFADSAFTCAISAQGTAPVSGSYVAASASSITIHASALVTGVVFSYICMR
jgi:hypothetical protein